MLPRTARERRQAAGRLTDVIEAYDPLGPAPGAPDWVCIHSPGHTPGHAAYYRAGDGVLISGDAVLTVNLNSIRGVLRGAQEVSPAPRYTMWNWPLAVQSIATLAAVRPRVLASGYGRPLASDTALALHALACRLARYEHERRRGVPDRSGADRGGSPGGSPASSHRASLLGSPSQRLTPSSGGAPDESC